MMDWIEGRFYSESPSPLQLKEKELQDSFSTRVLLRGLAYPTKISSINVSIDMGFVGFGEAPPPPMATKVKGFFKGIKSISQIFVVKEHELDIGYPTDVRHVAHIGWDSSSMNSPSWMTEFKTASDFSSTSLSNFGESREDTWASQEFDQHRVQEPGLSGMFTNSPACSEIPKAPKKKVKRKKTKVSSPSASSKSSRFRNSSRSSYATAIEEAGELQSQITVA